MITANNPHELAIQLADASLVHLRITFPLQDLLPAFPPMLVTLRMCGSSYPLPSFPSSLRELRISGACEHPLPPFPDTLEKLVIEGEFNSPLPPFPDSLWYLSINGAYDYPLSTLPEELAVLIICGTYNQPLPVLPQGLKDFRIRNRESKFKQIIRSLPSNLDRLQIEGDFSGYLPLFPTKLRHLEIRCSSLYSLPSLPKSLRILHVGGLHAYPLTGLPHNLHTLCLYPEFTQTVRIPACLHTFISGQVEVIGKFPAALHSIIFWGIEWTLPALPSQLRVFNGRYLTGPLPVLPARLLTLMVPEAYPLENAQLPAGCKVMVWGERGFPQMRNQDS